MYLCQKLMSNELLPSFHSNLIVMESDIISCIQQNGVKNVANKMI